MVSPWQTKARFVNVNRDCALAIHRFHFSASYNGREGDKSKHNLVMSLGPWLAQARYRLLAEADFAVGLTLIVCREVNQGESESVT